MCDEKGIKSRIFGLEVKEKKYRDEGNTSALLATYISLANLFDILKDVTTDKKESEEARIKMSMYVEEALKIESTVAESKGSCKKFSPLSFVDGSEECKQWFSTIVGLSDVKKAFTDSFINPLKYPSLYGGIPKGILLYGPPGVGKTAVVKAAINELQTQSNIKILFYAPSSGQLKGKFFGETERSIKALFECASRAACEETKDVTSKVISVIFLDEVESIASRRDKDTTGFMKTTVNALLTAIEGVESYPNVSVIAATNFPWTLDSAFLRRFSRQIYFDLPDSSDIYKMLTTYLGSHFDRLLNRDPVSLKKMCDEKKNGKIQGTRGCRRAEITESEIWKSPEYADYTRNINDSELRALSVVCAKEHYSGSDIKQIFNQAVIISAEAAVKHNAFYKIRTTNLQEKFYSTLSMSEDVLYKTFCSTPEKFQYAQIPDILYIDADDDKTIYINKSIYPLISITDDTIDDYFIKKTNCKGESKQSEIDILLGFKVFVQQGDTKVNSPEKYERIREIVRESNLTLDKIKMEDRDGLIKEFKDEKKVDTLIGLLKETNIPGLVIERMFFLRVKFVDTRYFITRRFSNGVDDILRGGLASLYKYGTDIIIKDWFTGEYKTYEFKSGTWPTWLVSGPILGVAKSKKVITTTNIFTYTFDTLVSKSTEQKYHVHYGRKPYNRLAVSYLLEEDTLINFKFVKDHREQLIPLLKEMKDEEKKGVDEKDPLAIHVKKYREIVAANKNVQGNFVNFDIRSQYFTKAKSIISSTARDEDIANMKKYETNRQEFLKEKEVTP
jgi:SpoVK/Ycf46/Vps4 family AAA+-type ATPase